MTTFTDELQWKLGRTGTSSGDATYSSPLLDGWKHLEAAEHQLGLGLGQPFLLRSDGAADPAVVSYFASPSFRRLAPGTQDAYAADLRLFLTFLEHQGTPWRHAVHDTLLDYEYWRRRDADNPRRISGSKFARELAACSHFYRWQATRGNVGASPVMAVGGLDRRGEPVSRAALQPTNVRSVKVKWLTPRAYRRWRDVGLRGYSADGVLEPGWRGRNDGRNAALSDLIWASGLRLREAGTLLLEELPRAVATENYLRGRLARAVAKGEAREYWVSRHALQQIAAYVMTTRAGAVRRAQAAGRYNTVAERIVVTGISPRGDVSYEDVRGRAGTTSFDVLDRRDRARLFRRTTAGLEPLAVWLTEAGMPMSYLTWDAVFSGASERCRRLGVPITCHPHMLRHSFALRMLVTLVHAFDRRLGLTEHERLEYRHLFGDPWVLVQTMLGHSNLTTTRAYYLEPVQGLQVDLFLNGDVDDDSVQHLLSSIARRSARVLDDTDGPR